MTADFVARLGSRALVPGDVHSSGSIAELVARMVRPGVEDDLDAVLRAARARRRIDEARLRALLVALADPPGQELNRIRLGDATAIPPTTLPPYVDLLVELGVVVLLPGCRAAVARRAIGRPQVHFDDPAVARHLAGPSAAELVEFGGRRRLAPLLRTMVAAELFRQQRTSTVEHRIGHLRERNGLAVGIVVELPDDSVYGLEVRTAASLRPHQFDSLRALATRAGPRFRGGVVLNTGPVGHVFGPRLWSLPISAVWGEDLPSPRR